MKISANRIITADNCMRSVWYRYVLGITTSVKPANLAFGSAIDAACTEYLRTHTMGLPIPDLEAFFQKEWESEIDCEVEYSSTQTPEKFLKMGQAMSVQFKKAWEDTGLDVFIMPNGEPALQVKLECNLSPGIDLLGYLDLIAMDSNGSVLVIDLKTAAASYDLEFTEQSDQLTTYQILMEENADTLGIEGVDGLAFMCMLKKTKPVIEQPHIVKPRTELQLNDFRQKCSWFYKDYKSGRFPKSAKHAYNSPCSLCNFKDLCTYGDDTGLVIPKNAQAELSLVAA